MCTLRFYEKPHIGAFQIAVNYNMAIIYYRSKWFFFQFQLFSKTSEGDC